MKTELQTYTHQEAFDKVAVHLIKQGEKSLNDGGCAYRGCNGKMCAAGVFIPDNVYNKDRMEERLIGDFWNEYPDLYRQFSFDEYERFLERMQHIHDNTTPDMWVDELIEYAVSRSLSTNALINALNKE